MIPVKSTFTINRKADPITLKEELAAGYQSYRISYSVMTDAFKLRNQNFRHTLLYNTDKPSKLESVSLRLRRKRMIYTLGLFILVGILWFLDVQLHRNVIRPGMTSDNFFFLSILFLGLFQYIVNLIHPGMRQTLKVEHGEVRSRVEQILTVGIGRLH